MQVVLLERVEKLGQMGEVVQVRDGFGRNFLLRQGKALRATKGNLARFEAQRAQLEARNLEQKKEAEQVAKKLDGQSFVIIRQASEGGALYGSVTARDVAEAASEGGFSVERRQIVLDRPVKELGLHPIRVVLHPEVDATVTANVARSRDEAALQAQGKTIAELRAEEEAAEQAEFDVQSLFERGEDDEQTPRGMEIIDQGGEEER
jgi:large subunit ribosomal protein L9